MSSKVVAIKEIRVNRGLDKPKIKAEAEAKNKNEDDLLEQAKANTEGAWDREAMALESMNKINSPHIVKCIAAIRRGDNRYFMFPWADGDSLRDFWESKPEQGNKLDEGILHELLQQLRGLANALDMIHNFEDKPDNLSDPEDVPPESNMDTPALQLNDETLEYTFGKTPSSIRHGDLKPENLLRFLDGKPNLGTLKIADMGLAKRHVVATQDRTSLTSTRYGTIRYEAPEAKTAPSGRSRLYDIWSMGCITFESIVWVLYGYNELKKFYKDLRGGTEKETEYYELEGIEPDQTAKVHRVVQKWLEVIQKIDPECSKNSAINDLLKLVKTKLIVVKLPPNRPSTLDGPSINRFQPPEEDDDNPLQGVRATARIFRDGLDEILDKVNRKTPEYLVTGRPRKSPKPSKHIETTSGPFLSTTRTLASSTNQQLGTSSKALDNTTRVSLSLALRGRYSDFPFKSTASNRVKDSKLSLVELNCAVHAC
jgi:serine/threonine protein kinase